MFDLISFNGNDNINQVLDYIGCKIYTKTHDRKKDAVDIYYEDLIGSIVYDENNKRLGKVKKVEEFPAQITLRVARDYNRDFFVPFIKEFIVSTDIENKKIVIKVMEGML